MSPFGEPISSLSDGVLSFPSGAFSWIFSFAILGVEYVSFVLFSFCVGISNLLTFMLITFIIVVLFSPCGVAL